MNHSSGQDAERHTSASSSGPYSYDSSDNHWNSSISGNYDLTCSLSSSFSPGGAPRVDGSPLPSVLSAPQATAGSRTVLGGVSPDLAGFRSGVDCGLLR